MIKFATGWGLAAFAWFLAALPVMSQDNPEAIKKRKLEHRARMCYLDNGQIKIGVDLSLGGAITYLSRSGSDDNCVNNWDWGRQIQMSHYAGPASFRVEGKTVAGHWRTFPWNPVQTGDHFGFASKTLDSRADDRQIHVKCRPMQWSLENAPSDCIFETWIELNDAAAHVRCRLTAQRTDRRQYPALDQEMPALYMNGPFHRLYSYTGNKPFTGDAMNRIEKAVADRTDFPWSRFLATEHWAALVNDDGWGVGVYQPRCVRFLGGFAGQPGKGGPGDSPTGYLAPVRQEIIDHDIVFDYDYVLIVGKLEEIRKSALRLAGPPVNPDWTFEHDRQGWWLENGPDSGWPIKGRLEVSVGQADVHLVGPPGCWQAEQARKLRIDLAAPGNIKHLKVFWGRHDDPRFSADKTLLAPVAADGEFHEIEIDLGKSGAYKGAITQLRIDPIAASAEPGLLRVKSIRLP